MQCLKRIAATPAGRSVAAGAAAAELCAQPTVSQDLLKEVHNIHSQAAKSSTINATIKSSINLLKQQQSFKFQGNQSVVEYFPNFVQGADKFSLVQIKQKE